MFFFLMSKWRFGMVVVFNHNIPVRFINQLKLKGLSRSHPVHMATAAVVNRPAKKKEKKRKKE